MESKRSWLSSVLLVGCTLIDLGLLVKVFHRSSTFQVYGLLIAFVACFGAAGISILNATGKADDGHFSRALVSAIVFLTVGLTIVFYR